MQVINLLTYGRQQKQQPSRRLAYKWLFCVQVDNGKPRSTVSTHLDVYRRGINTHMFLPRLQNQHVSNFFSALILCIILPLTLAAAFIDFL